MQPSPKRRGLDAREFFIQPCTGMNLIPISHALSEARAEHDYKCPGDVPIELGPAHQYYDDLDEDDRHDYWIQDGILCALIRCPGGYHEEFKDLVQGCLLKKFEAECRAYVKGSGSKIQRLNNPAGCHNEIGKEPDSSISMRPRNRGSQVYPIVVSEVAVNHEDETMLFSEVAAWLSHPSDTRYALASKLKEARDGTLSLDMFLFEGDDPATTAQERRTAQQELEQNAENRRAKRLPVAEEQASEKKWCRPRTDHGRYTADMFREEYSLNLKCHWHLEEDDKQTVTLSLKKSKLFGLADVPEPFKKGSLTIPMTRAIRQFFQDARYEREIKGSRE